METYPVMPDEDDNFGGSLVLDFWKWWCHMQAKIMTTVLSEEFILTSYQTWKQQSALRIWSSLLHTKDTLAMKN